MKINHKGFTLIEILVAMGIMTLIVSGITGILLYSFKSNKIIWEQLSTQNEGRRVVQDFTKELRTATASSIGAYAIGAAGPQQIIFYSDVDSDGLRERIRYFLDNKTLKKGVIKPAGNPLTYSIANETIVEIAHDIANGANPVFYYYDQNYVGEATNFLSDPVSSTAVRVVKITLDMEEAPYASPAPFHIETEVEVRNLKDN